MSTSPKKSIPIPTNGYCEKAQEKIEETIECFEKYRSYKGASNNLKRTLLNLREINKLMEK